VKSIEIQGDAGRSAVFIGERLKELEKYVSAEKVVIITDNLVRDLYQKAFPPWEVIEIGTGEKIKTLDTVRFLYDRLVALEADRSSFIVGIGGGIVCDIAGFVASTFLRGLRFGFVSSTLLSQVDASVGGKNGVNFGGYKNMVGVFNQPEFVICDTNLLKTLPAEELQNGFSEIVKHAALGNAELFSFVEDHYEKALDLDTMTIEKLVYESISIKSSIVNRDAKEKGERRKLNFGHTFGHAFEKLTGLPHGKAVSVGMVVASKLSVKKGYLSPEDGGRLERLLKRLGLPTGLSIDREKVLTTLRRDKKKEGNDIYFVYLHGLGHAVVEKTPLRELADLEGVGFENNCVGEQKAFKE
jgi:3-dehydroquinate synthase